VSSVNSSIPSQVESNNESNIDVSSFIKIHVSHNLPGLHLISREEDLNLAVREMDIVSTSSDYLL
jgi:hypothetical protein